MSRFLTALWLAVSFPMFALAGTSEAQKLVKQLKDKDPSVRAEAAWDLGKMGATEAVPALTAALSDPDDAVRGNAAASLWKLGLASRPAIPALKAALNDPAALVVGNAAGALRELGVTKAELIPAYKRVLNQPSCEARVIGLKGLVDDVPPTELFPSAWECSQTAKDSDVSSGAREVLDKVVRRRDKVMVPQILGALKTLGSRDPVDLTLALGNIKPAPTEAVPVLITLLNSKNPRAPSAAVRALGEMGPAALRAVPTIIELLNSKADVDIRAAAAEALGKVGPAAAATVVPVLIKTAQDKWPKVREASMGALAEMGPAAREAVPVLKAALKDPDVGNAASRALMRVQPDKWDENVALEKSRPAQQGSLLEDTSALSSTLAGRFPEVYTVLILEKFAIATAPYAESRSGRANFKYEAGALGGPEEQRDTDCKKKVLLSKVDFSLVPKIIKQAPGLVGSPSAKVEAVTVGYDVFCKGPNWLVSVKGGGAVQFKIDGKVDQVYKHD